MATDNILIVDDDIKNLELFGESATKEEHFDTEIEI